MSNLSTEISIETHDAKYAKNHFLLLFAYVKTSINFQNIKISKVVNSIEYSSSYNCSIFVQIHNISYCRYNLQFDGIL